MHRKDTPIVNPTAVKIESYLHGPSLPSPVPKSEGPRAPSSGLGPVTETVATRRKGPLMLVVSHPGSPQ